MKQDDRRFEGAFNISLQDYKNLLKEEHPDWTDEQLDVVSREMRNFDKKHLKAYLSGKQVAFWKKDITGRRKAFVVKGRYKR